MKRQGEETYILYMVEAKWRTLASVLERFCGECFIMSVEKTEKEQTKI